MRPDAVAYLLGELDAGAAVAFEAVLERDPALRVRLDRLRPVVARLERLPAEAWDAPPPPPLALAPARPARRRLVLRPLAAAACALALLAAGAGLGTLLDRDGGAGAPVRTIALAPLPGAGDAGGRVELSRSGAAPLTLRVRGLRPVARGRFYELWLLGPRGELVSLGSFTVDRAGHATLALPLPVDPRRFRSFDVSVEPADGDPGHSGDSVLRGPTGS